MVPNEKLELNLMLIKEIRAGKVTTIQEILNDPNLIDSDICPPINDPKRFDPLRVAIFNNQIGALKLLIDHRFVVTNQFRRSHTFYCNYAEDSATYGLTLLMMAAKMGNNAIVKLLMGHDKSKDSINVMSSNKTADQIADEHDHEEIADMLRRDRVIAFFKALESNDLKSIPLKRESIDFLLEKYHLRNVPNDKLSQYFFEYVRSKDSLEQEIALLSETKNSSTLLHIFTAKIQLGKPIKNQLNAMCLFMHGDENSESIEMKEKKRAKAILHQQK